MSWPKVNEQRQPRRWRPALFALLLWGACTEQVPVEPVPSPQPAPTDVVPEPLIREPSDFTRSIHRSEQAVVAVKRSALRLLCAGFRSGNHARLSKAWTADFRGSYVQSASSAPAGDALGSLTRRVPEAVERDGAAFTKQLSDEARAFQVVERCETKLVGFKLVEGPNPWAYGRIKLEIGGQEREGKRRSLSALLEAELVPVDPARVHASNARWIFRRLAFGPMSDRRSSAQRFIDVSGHVGIGLHRSPAAEEAVDLIRDHFLTWTTSGLGIIDWNGDGFDDLYTWDRRRAFVLFQNDGKGGFTKRTNLLPAEAVGQFQLFVDLDGDDVDELVSSEIVSCRKGRAELGLFQRQGDQLVPLPGAIGFPHKCISYHLFTYHHITAADIDDDGDLDLFVSGTSSPHSKGAKHNHLDATDGLANRLFINQGNLRFEEDAAGRGLRGERWSYVGQLADVDNDGDSDLYVANDYAPNDLYLNDGQGHFSEKIQPPLTDSGNSMGISLADLDGDARLDLYVSNMYSAAGQRIVPLAQERLRADLFQRALTVASGNTLYLQAKDGSYREAGHERGVHQAGWAWGQTAFDADNDGDLELYVVNGNASHSSIREDDF